MLRLGKVSCLVTLIKLPADTSPAGRWEREACGRRDLSVCDLCSPVPSISWRRADGNPLPGKIKVNHSSGVLEIPYFRPEDAGVYECVAANSKGRNVARGQLVFNSKSLVYFCLLVSRT